MLLLNNPLIRFLAPPVCAVCRREVSVRHPQQILCAACTRTLDATLLGRDGRCSRCFSPLRDSACGYCAGRIVFFDEHYSLFPLTRAWKRVVHRWKYEQERRLFQIFLPALFRLWRDLRPVAVHATRTPLRSPPEQAAAAERIVYIDSGREGFALRSFQPCRDLARELGNFSDLAWGDDLYKIGNRQSSNSRFFRHFRVQDSLGARRPPAERVILLEDVFTTGATANEAARILKKNGAKFVQVISLLFREDLR